MNPYEIAITRCKELEQLLSQLGADGRGLHDKVSSIADLLTPRLISKLRFIATARNQLVHESGDWSDYEVADYTRACDWARDELQRIVSGRTAPPAERPTPTKPRPPVGLLSLFGFATPANPTPPVQRPSPLKPVPLPADGPVYARPALPIERPAPIKFSSPAAPAHSEPAPYSPPVQRAARGVAYADAWPPAPVRRFGSRRRIPVVLPIVLLFIAGAASSGRLPQIADAVRDLVDRGLQQAIESGNADEQPASPAARSEDRLPEIVPGPY